MFLVSSEVELLPGANIHSGWYNNAIIDSGTPQENFTSQFEPYSL
jgi:hypothetical protein